MSLIYLFLFKIISAAITPGTQPQSVSRNTMSIEPQPRSYTAKGGKRMERRTRRKDIFSRFYRCGESTNIFENETMFSCISAMLHPSRK